jgi:glycosyltransferase involved in cell wall biosynthesis
MKINKRNPLVSIIIRTKNEEKWISSCLDAINNQLYKNYEIIIVDNNSKDGTIKIAKTYKTRIFKIDKFKPGKTINLGIRKSRGSIIVCLSGHCIPVNNNWLTNLIKNLKIKNVAGVYGRQEPFLFSSDNDKRDLINLFGLDKKIQVKDTFFHNANSCFYKKTWKKFPFNEEVTNIEDRVWGENIIQNGYKIVYEPKASVYHHHGVHHNMNEERARNVVKILESLKTTNTRKNILKKKNIRVLALIPLTGKTTFINSTSLLEITINSAKRSKFINNIIFLGDDKESIKIAKKLDIETPIKRPESLSGKFVSDVEILNYTIKKLESQKRNYDLIICLKETYPFRSDNLIDNMIAKLLEEGLDTIFAAKAERRNVWKVDTKKNTNVSINNLIPRDLRKDITLISLFGLCSITYPWAIKSGDLFKGKKVGIFEVEDQISSIEVRDKISLKLTEQILNINKLNI